MKTFWLSLNLHYPDDARHNLLDVEQDILTLSTKLEELGDYPRVELLSLVSTTPTTGGSNGGREG